MADIDEAMLAVVVTAVLIRGGGELDFTPEEWKAAIDHEGSMFVSRSSDDKPVKVILLGKVVQA